ncbi:putative NADH:ubiquinone oxidoreductase 12.5 kDa subunit precursor [Dunaliella salina]|uniref:CHCH domain-containing protein n=2 Tax=Dunaliella TaxID=3044 RepID=A0A7S3VUE2_DUNTE|nr:putative NADH:ubiquinone oxidoreductase 12.5 kDa subunit precursor [Dunaliella salina]|mmetsp:Transcript_25144/g.64936  ORF Transcript_25144/g.64936 Transcript_25144/m.64936 type:complete len:106 (+) Transcript_25144:94-411(+)|eukprot:KAF5840216.1 putative NADH:ubiquinone oxidoreductase 12.5 kDa subunit precursor [Dunaliella salina]
MARVPYSHELYALSRHIVFRREKEHNDAKNCKEKHDWPEDCRPESEALIRGVNQLYLDAMAAAPEEFKEFATCLDHYGLRFARCRDKQKAFEKAFPLVEGQPPKQ